MKTIYPSIEKKVYPTNNQTLYLFNKSQSIAFILGLIFSFRSLIRKEATSKTTKDTIPVIRSDQASDRFSIIGTIEKLHTIPPIPEPAAAIPCARLRFLLNHCGRSGVAGNQTKPVPSPTRTP